MSVLCGISVVDMVDEISKAKVAIWKRGLLVLRRTYQSQH